MAIQSLLSSSTSLRNISKSMTSISSSMVRSSVLARNIAKDINKDNLEKTKALERGSSFFRKRNESLLRRKKEEEVEASSPGSIFTQVGKTVKNSVKGFLGRVLDIFAITLLGWLIKNLPSILKGIDALVKRIGRLLEVLNGWSNGIGNLFQSFGVELDKTQETINSADFQESQDLIKKDLESTNIELNQFGMQVSDVGSQFQSKGKNIEDELKKLEKKLDKDADTIDSGEMPEDSENSDEISDDESLTPKDKSWWENVMYWMYGHRRGDDKENEVMEYAAGGMVKGPGGIDNVPAKLTAGEFVISKKAVDKWGVSFLSALNKMNIASTEGGLEEFGVGDIKKVLEDEKRNGRVYESLFTTMKQMADDIKPIVKSSEFNDLKNTAKNISKEIDIGGDLSGIFGSIKDIMSDVGETIRPELEGLAEEVKPIVKSSEFETLKKTTQSIFKEIRPKSRKTIMVPLPAMSSGSKQSGNLPVGSSTSIPQSGSSSDRLLYKRLTTLITSYT